jgi:hypothetical protein
MLRLPAARRITGFSEDGEWAFLEGSTTGVPVAELNLSDAPPPSVVPPSPPSAAALVKPPPYEPGEKLKSALRTPPPNPQYVAPANVRQDVFSLGEGPVTIQWPASLSPESFQDLSAWLDILKRKIGRSVPFKVTKRDVIVKLRAGYRIDGDPESDTPCALIDPSQTNFDSCALVPAEMLRELLDDGIVENNTGDGRRLFKMA